MFTHLWPMDRLGAGLVALANRSGLNAGAEQALTVPPDLTAGKPGEAQELSAWMDWAAQQLGLQAEPVQCERPQVPSLLHRAAPALVMLTTPQGSAFVLLLGRRGQQVTLLGPDLRARACAVGTLRDLLCGPAEAPHAAPIDDLLASVGVPQSRLAKARQTLLEQRLAAEPVQGMWLLRRPATSSLWQQWADVHASRRLVTLLMLFALLYGLEIAGWRLIGEAALDGRFDVGWLSAWILLLLTLVPLRLLSSSINAGIVLDAGVLLRQRLLAGSLRMDLDTLRRQGSGQLLARVMESQALESAGLAGVLGLAVALLELGLAGWVLLQGAAPVSHALLLASWLGMVTALAWRHQGRLRAWSEERLDMTQSLVERMVGHRTRLAQERPERRVAEEDHELQRYLLRSQALDRSLLPVVSLAPTGWILLALFALAPALGAAQSGDAAGGAAALAISIGGIVFAHRALAGVSGGLASLARAAVAWRQAAPLFKAGAVDTRATPFTGAQQPTAAMATGAPLLDAHELHYGYGSGGAAVLKGASLQMGPRDRVLLAGPSGSGKSTLAALLVGMRRPSAGLLMVGGMDRATLGDQWHRWATEAPQFHDNHVFTGTLAFNLLMGREWPPSPQALDEARLLCEELGLGPLLARMPAGLHQRVGETGWQLSHGERSRVFLARALLQRAPLTVLDESFAALDPSTLHQCLRSALQRAQALVVIAHP